MKILVRLPNWLGDMVMSVAAMHQLRCLYPDAEISVIAKQGLHELLEFFPPAAHSFIFSKEEYKGISGPWRFGKSIRATEKFDLFISFPDSFSAALMGFATGAKKRTGYKKEAREIFLTHSFIKPKGLHRVEEYLHLLTQYAGLKAEPQSVLLQHSFQQEQHIVININSEASSRRLTVEKATALVNAVREFFLHPLVLIGGPNEKVFVEEVFDKLKSKEGITSLAGKTSLAALCKTLATAQLVLTTDSGPAHLANALGTQTIVLFGAGNENNTAPYNKPAVHVIRLGKLSCEPCTKNVCVQFSTPQCLELLETKNIIAVMKEKLKQ